MIDRDFKLRTIIPNRVDLIFHDNRDRVDTLPTRKKEHRMKKDCWLQVTGKPRSRSQFPQLGWRTAWPARAAWDGCSPADATRRATRVSRLPRPGAPNGSGAAALTTSTTAWSSRDSS